MEIEILEKEIQKLSKNDQWKIVEATLKNLRQQPPVSLKEAAGLLKGDYLNDRELTAFSTLNGATFYE